MAPSLDICTYVLEDVGRPTTLFRILIFRLKFPQTPHLAEQKTIYGQAATLWTFDGSYEGYDATVDIAVSSVDNSIIFILLNPNFENFDLGTYLIFNNFNASKPDSATYAVPPGRCWDPIEGGPGTK